MALGLVLNRGRRVPAEDSPAFGAIAERFRRGGDLDRAVALCQEGLQKYPGHLSSRVTLGWALLDLGRYDEARVELEQVLKRAPDNLAAIRGLAELHDRTEHDDVASMQSGPSRWQAPEAPAPFRMPEAAAASEALDPESSPWLTPEMAAARDELEAPPILEAPASSPWLSVVARVDVGHEPFKDLGVDRGDDVQVDPDDVAPLSLDTDPAAWSLPVDEVDPEWPRPEPEPASASDFAPLVADLAPSVSDVAARVATEPVALAAAPIAEPVIDDFEPGPWPPPMDDPGAVAPIHHFGPALPENLDEGPGPWPPVFDEPSEPATVVAPAMHAVTTEEVVGNSTGRKRVLLRALDRFRRKVVSHREAVVSEYVAG